MKYNQSIVFLSINQHSTSPMSTFVTLFKNKFDFWDAHGIMNTLARPLGFTLTLQEIQSIHDSREFIAYIYILLYSETCLKRPLKKSQNKGLKAT